ncbi:MAG: dihydroorotase [Myxococcota bacterium]
MYDLIVEDATVVSSNGRAVVDVCVEGGRIAYVGPRPAGGARKKASAIGKFLIPGLVDTHVHFRSPGHPHKEDWASGSRAAASGGVTTVCDMPNTNPPTLSRAAWEEKRALAAESSRVNFGLWVGAAADNLDEINALMDSGDACGIKVFMGASTGPLLVDDPTLVRIFGETRGLLGVHAEDEALLTTMRERFAGNPSPDHNEVRPPVAAAAAVKRLVELSRAHQRAVHICHVSTSAELSVLEDVRGIVPITTEASPHHLWLSTENTQGNFTKVNPPIRSELDRRALWTAVKRNRIDTIGSDHAPHTREEKLLPYWEAPSGLPGVETTFSLLIAAIRQGRLSIERMVQLCCEAPARIFGLQRKGWIKAGYDADFALFTEEELVKLVAADLLTKVGWSPFVGQKIGARPEQVYVGGRLVAQRGRIVDDDVRGTLVRPGDAR